MRRKLAILNVTLALLAFYGGWRLREEWWETRVREAAILKQRVKPAPPPPFTPLPSAPPAVASGYAEIVDKMLFDRSRNPTVVVELPPPPPPKPMPALPAFYGTLNLGEGPVAILSIPPGPQKAIEIGESIGQFKLLGVNTEEIAFEWDGKTIRKKLSEVQPAGNTPAVAQQASTGRTEVVGPPAAPAAPPAQRPLGPGNDSGGGFKACQQNDSTPAGTVVSGYRKVVIPSPFGASCRWDPVAQ